MRRVCYSVAMSLDGYITGPNGEIDWIVMDPDIDFAAMFSRFDTVLMGRKSYEDARAQGGGGMPGMKSFVFSRTLNPAECPGVTVSANPSEVVSRLKAEQGKDIWLFGGGLLFRECLALGLVDQVEVAVVPALLGGGVPFLPPPASRAKLKLVKHRLYDKTGIVLLDYAVEGRSKPKPGKSKTKSV